jgi:hypothetical protein
VVDAVRKECCDGRGAAAERARVKGEAMEKVFHRAPA